MPEPFLESAAAHQGKLHVSWMAPAFDTRATFVAVAEDAELTLNRRIFVLPLVAQTLLTVGNGNWYVCVGAAHGSTEQGVISWSGIHGPVHVQTTDVAHPVPDVKLPVLHAKPVDRGYRIHTGKSDPHIVVFEMGRVGDVGTHFPAGNTHWKWVAEKGFYGWVECWGLTYPDTYAIRMSTIETPTFPTDRVVMLGQSHVFPRVVCARTPFYRHFEGKQDAIGDSILLHSRKVNPTLKFSSHGEYLRYQAALTRSGHDNARAVGPAHFSAMEEGRL